MIKSFVNWTLYIVVAVIILCNFLLYLEAFQSNNLIHFVGSMGITWVVICICYALNYMEKH